MRAPKGLALVLCLSLGQLGCAPGAGGPDPRPGQLSELAPQLKGAIEQAVEAVLASPSSSQSWLDLAELYHANNLLKDAERCYARALELRPRAREIYLLGMLRWDLGQAQQASEDWLQARGLEPDYAPIHWRLGNEHMQAGRLPEARAAFGRALELAPGDQAASLGLARCELALGQPQLAADLLEPLLERNKRDKRALNLMARVLERLGRSKEAERLALREQKAQVAPENDPWLAEVFQRRIGALALLAEASHMTSLGQAGQAIELLQEELQRSPDNLGVLNMLLGTLVFEQRYDEVLALFGEIGAERRAHHLLLLHHGQALMGLGRLPEALQSFQKALDLAPGYGACHAGLGEAYLRLGRNAEAADALLRATRLDQTSVRDWLILGQAELKAERFEAALLHAQEALGLHPQVPDLWALAAEAALATGQVDEAQRWIAMLKQRRPNSPKLKALEARLAQLSPAQDQ